MAKTYVVVANPTELTSVWVSQFEDGAFAYSVSTQEHYSLIKNPTGAPVMGDVFPADGAPKAGQPNALWTPLGF